MKFWLLPLLGVLVSRCMASSVAITTTSLPGGTVTGAYWALVQATGGCTPYKWAIVSGALPAGVAAKMSSTTTSLTLSGTLTTAATYAFTVKVTGCGGHVSKIPYSVVIQATSNHVVDLSWKASTSSGVAGYNLYRSPDAATWRKVNMSLIPSTLYSDSTVASHTTYYYA